MKPTRIPRLPAHERAAQKARASIIGIAKPKPVAPPPRIPVFCPKFDPVTGYRISYGIDD